MASDYLDIVDQLDGSAGEFYVAGFSGGALPVLVAAVDLFENHNTTVKGVIFHAGEFGAQGLSYVKTITALPWPMLIIQGTKDKTPHLPHPTDAHGCLEWAMKIATADCPVDYYGFNGGHEWNEEVTQRVIQFVNR